MSPVDVRRVDRTAFVRLIEGGGGQSVIFSAAWIAGDWNRRRAVWDGDKVSEIAQWCGGCPGRQGRGREAYSFSRGGNCQRRHGRREGLLPVSGIAGVQGGLCGGREDHGALRGWRQHQDGDS